MASVIGDDAMELKNSKTKKSTTFLTVPPATPALKNSKTKKDCGAPLNPAYIGLKNSKTKSKSRLH